MTKSRHAPGGTYSAPIFKNHFPILLQYGVLTATKLTKAIAEARQAGYSRIADFAVPGVAGIGVPVLDPVGSPIVALSVATVTMRMTPQHQAEALSVLSHEAARLKAVLHKHSVISNREKA